MDKIFLSSVRKNRFTKFLSALIAASFLFYGQGFASTTTPEPTSKNQPELRQFALDTFGVSKDIGTVKNKYAAKGPRTIIHIQDAHCNYEAQTNISNILESLSKEYNVNLISVEGADGYVDTSWFKAFPDAEIRKEVADYFMKKGEITGAEFLSITKDYPIKLYGAENRELYIQNLNAFTETYAIKNEIEAYLVNLKNVLLNLKNYVYSKDLKAFDSKHEEYKDKKITLSDYAKFLSVQLKRHSLDLKKYQDFSKLVYTLVYEDKINFDTVNIERTELIDTLSKDLKDEKLKELVGKSVDFKAGRLSPAEYYQYLKEVSVANGIDINTDYPNLANYVIYTRLYEKINNEKLFDELDQIRSDILSKLFENDDQKELNKAWENIQILIGMLNIKLTNKEYDMYKAHRDDFHPESIINFIRPKISLFNLAYNIQPPNAVTFDNIQKMENFYEVAIARDKVLLENTLKAMDTEKSDIAVLITGGFHTEGMRKMLEQKGISYAVLCPTITKDVESPYIQVLTNQRTPFEELLVESATPTKKDSLLAPIILSELIAGEILKDPKHARGLDKFVTKFEQRVQDAENAWIKAYLKYWQIKAREIAQANAELNIEVTNDLLLKSFQTAILSRIKQAHLNVSQAAANEILTIAKAYFASSQGTPGTQLIGPYSGLTEEQAKALDQLIAKSFEAGTFQIIPVTLPENKTFNWVVHFGLKDRIKEYNRTAPSNLTIPTNLHIHPGRGGDAQKHALLQGHIDAFEYFNLIPEQRERAQNHEAAHIDIFNGLQVLAQNGYMSHPRDVAGILAFAKAGKTQDALRTINGNITAVRFIENLIQSNGRINEENFVDTMPFCDTASSIEVRGRMVKGVRDVCLSLDQIWAAGRKAAIDNNDIDAMEKFINADVQFGDRAKKEIAAMRKASDPQLNDFIRKIFTVRLNIDNSVNAYSGRPYSGYKRLMPISSDSYEMSAKQKQMDSISKGTNLEVVSSQCHPEHGQLPGLVASIRKQYLHKDKLNREQGKGSLDWDMFLDNFFSGLIIIPDAGKGERSSFIPQVFDNARAGQPDIGWVYNGSGELIPATLFPMIVANNMDFANMKDADKYVSVFWASQRGYGTILHNEVKPSKGQFIKFTTPIVWTDAPVDSPEGQTLLEKLFYFGTLIYDDNGNIEQFFGNQLNGPVRKNPETKKWEWNPDRSNVREALEKAAKKHQAGYDYGSFLITKDLFKILCKYWVEKINHKTGEALIDTYIKNSENPGVDPLTIWDKEFKRDIDPNFTQPLTFILQALSVDTDLRAALQAAEQELNDPSVIDKRAKIRELIPRVRGAIPESTKPLICDTKNGVDTWKTGVDEVIEILLLYRKENPDVLGDLSNPLEMTKLIGSVSLGEDIFWETFRTAPDIFKRKIAMLDDTIEAENARRLNMIPNSRFCDFYIDGEHYILTKEQVSGSVPFQVKDKNGNVLAKIHNSIIQGSYLTAGSEISNSVVNHSYGKITASGSYIERCVVSALNATDSAIINGTSAQEPTAENKLFVNDRLVGDMFRKDIADPRAENLDLSLGQTRVIVDMQYDPKSSDSTRLEENTYALGEENKVTKEVGIRGMQSITSTNHALENSAKLLVLIQKPCQEQDAMLKSFLELINKRGDLSTELLTTLTKEAEKQASSFRVMTGMVKIMNLLIKLDKANFEMSASYVRDQYLKRLEMINDDNMPADFDRAEYSIMYYKSLKFGTSGLRDKDKFMTDMEVYINTKGFIDYLLSLGREKGGLEKGDTVALAGDFRPSTPSILKAVTKAILDSGCRVDFQGLIPTEAVTFYGMSNKMPSIMVTGSHIPFGMNGIKFNRSTGEVLKAEEKPILAAVANVRKTVYALGYPTSPFTIKGSFKDETKQSQQEKALLKEAGDILAAPDLTARKMFIDRYKIFGTPLKGKEIVLLEQTAVGREIIKEILENLGATVYPVLRGTRPGHFYPVDTEKMTGTRKRMLKRLSSSFLKNTGRLPYAVVTADGDSDRPVVCDENGQFLSGDKLGVLTSLYLKPNFVALPITCNSDAVAKLQSIGAQIESTDVGSPFIVKAMQDAEIEFAKTGTPIRAAGYEANGGYLTGTSFMINGKELAALPTRDAILPMISALILGTQGIPSLNVEANKPLSVLFNIFSRQTAADIVDDKTPGCEKYEAPMGAQIVKMLSIGTNVQEIDLKRKVITFKDKTVKSFKEVPEYKEQIDRVNALLKRAFSKLAKTNVVFPAVTKINYISGVRIYFANRDAASDTPGDIVHLRPSGNAPEFRYYTESDTQDNADLLLKTRLEVMPRIFGEYFAFISGKPVVASANEAIEPELAYGTSTIDTVLSAVTSGNITEAITVFNQIVATDKTTDAMKMIGNNFIAKYTASGNETRIAMLRSLAQFTGAIASKASDKNAIEIMFANIIFITKLIDRGETNAASIRLTANPDDMLKGLDGKGKDRGLSYLSLSSLENSGFATTKNENTKGVHFRGVERGAKIQPVIINEAFIYAYNDSVNNNVLYEMLHGATPVPLSLTDATLANLISTMHDTLFINGRVADSIQQISTGVGHFQGSKLDIKELTEGTGMQVIQILDTNGNVVKVLVNIVKAGERTLALPGTVDIFIPLSSVVHFNDISIDLAQLSTKDAERMAMINKINPFLKGLDLKGKPFADMLDMDKVQQAFDKLNVKPVAYQVINMNGTLKLYATNARTNVAIEFVKFSNVLANIDGLKGKSLVDYYRKIDKGEADIRKLVEGITKGMEPKVYGKDADIMSIATIDDIRKNTKALNELGNIIDKGGVITIEDEFNTSKNKYNWGEPALKSFILEQMGYVTEDAKRTKASEMGLNPDKQVISERVICSGEIVLPSGARLPVQALTLFAEKIFGRDHLAAFGPATGITAKVLCSNVALSAQKHGFDEMIYALEYCEAYIGLKANVTENQFMDVMLGKVVNIEGLGQVTDILQLLNKAPLKAGDSLVVTAGTIHAYDKVRVYEVKATTPEEDRTGTVSFFDRLKYLGWSKETWKKEYNEKLVDIKKKIATLSNMTDKKSVAERQMLESFVAQEVTEFPDTTTSLTGITAPLLGVVNFERRSKDVLTMTEEERQAILTSLAASKTTGGLNVVDMAALRFTPVVTDRDGSDASFTILGATDRFITGMYSVNERKSLKSPKAFVGRAHDLLVLEGDVKVKTDRGEVTLKKGQTLSLYSDMITKGYTIINTGTTPVKVVTQVRPFKSGDAFATSALALNQTKSPIVEAILSPEAGRTAQESNLINTVKVSVNKAGYVDRINLVDGNTYDVKIEDGKSAVALNLVHGNVSVKINGKTFVLEQDRPVAFPVWVTNNNISLIGTGEVIFSTPVNGADAPVYRTAAGLADLKKNDVIRTRVKEAGKDGIAMLMTEDLAQAIYRKGKSTEDGHLRKEESLLSEYLGIKVKIVSGKTWEDTLSKADKLEGNYIKVAWATDTEINKTIKPNASLSQELSRLHMLPIDNKVVIELTQGRGWFYTRELEGISAMVAVTNKNDIESKSSIAETVMNTINVMIANPVKDISDLRFILPVDESNLTSASMLMERFNSLINNILIKMPIKAFDAGAELNKRRQVLWSA